MPDKKGSYTDWFLHVQISDWIALLGVLVSIGIALYSKRESHQAKLRAINAEAIAEEALAAQKQIAANQATLATVEEEREKRERAEIDAGPIRDRWCRELTMEWDRKTRGQRSGMISVRKSIGSLAEHLAAESLRRDGNIGPVLHVVSINITPNADAVDFTVRRKPGSAG